MFHIVEQEDDDAILRYVFQWMTNRDTVKFQPASSAFAEKVKKAALKGAVFHCGLGVIKK